MSRDVFRSSSWDCFVRIGSLTGVRVVPPGSENVNAYCLHIAEDDGEVDTDFPPLDSNEPIHKFGFSTLALVEKFSSPGLASRQSLFVRMLVCFRLLLKLKPGIFTRLQCCKLKSKYNIFCK